MSELPDRRERERAVDPTRSLLVQAPAGSGKTTLLVTRYMRLLERVERPEEVLALTFTVKAAAEMRNRVQASLADPANALGRRVQQRSVALGWHLDTQPGRLRILTIDSFAASLTAALPVAAGIGESKIVTYARPLYEEAVLALFERIDADDDIGANLAGFLALHDNDYARAKRSLVEMLGRREQWVAPVRRAMRLELDRPESLRAQLGDAVHGIYVELIETVRDVLDEGQAAELIELTRWSASVSGLTLSGDNDHPQLWRHAARVFLTQQGAPRRRLTVKEGFPSKDREGREIKARALALLASAPESIERLAPFLHAPNLSISDEEVAALLPIAITLSLAAAELSTCFKHSRSIDFNELLIAAKRTLGSPEQPTDLALALDHRIRHLLVDEFQDTSAAQLEFLEMLVAGWTPGDGRTLFAVGDPMQSIYLFRDADVSLFQHAARHGIGATRLEPISLTTNFRSHTEIIDWCNRTFPNVFGTQTDPTSGAMTYQPATAPDDAASGGEVAVRWFLPSTDDGGEARYIASHVQRLRESVGEESIAVLVRNRIHARLLIEELDRRRIPWHGNDMTPLADEPAVRDLLAMYRAAWDPGDRLAWFALLRGPLVGLNRSDLTRIAESDGPIGAEFAGGRFDTALSRDGRERTLRARAIWLAMTPSRLQLPPAQWLEMLWLQLGGVDAYDDPNAREHVARVLSLIEDEQPNYGMPIELQSAITRLYAQPGHEERAINITTIHGAKGLEFDHVVLPSLDKPARVGEKPLVMWQPGHAGLLVGSIAASANGSVYAWLHRQHAARNSNERARLLYVAATRARRSLLLTAEYDPGGASPAPRSLLELIDGNVQGRMQPASERNVLWRNEPAAELRLRADFEFCAPISVQPLYFEGPGAADRAHADAGFTRAVAIGIVIHEELALLGRMPLPLDPAAHLTGRRPRIVDALRELGALDQFAAEEVIAHLDRTLCDEVGRWILRCNGESEVSVRALIDGRITSHVIDRMIVDEARQTWVIDFKTGSPSAGESVADFIASQLRDHAAQVRRYARMLAAMNASPPRAALYLTGVPRLVEVDPIP